MALLAAARRASSLPSLRRASTLLRPTSSSAMASRWSSSSSLDAAVSSFESSGASLIAALDSYRQSTVTEESARTVLGPIRAFLTETESLSATMFDLELLGAIDSAIKSRNNDGQAPTELQCLLAKIEETGDYFPFEISENKCRSSITLTRTLKGEKIEVVASKPCLDDDDDENNSSCTSHEDVESPSASSNENLEEDGGQKNKLRSSINLEVTISKGDGSKLAFTCLAYPDNITIHSMCMLSRTDKDDVQATYYDFDKLDENLQKSFVKYLDMRGVTPTTTNLLRVYLSSKVQSKDLLMLTKLQDFVKKD
ncbi:hypothetical protein CFC21_039592 [Triticum aestivum]|uniref:Uncharacterized protein n=3 Tax=Triticum TaxID=4564 RepID=A0A9R1RXD1_TRITD|nr:uncharacterized protein At2g39795, mitochondrial-like [Triticum aestivum]KAF7027559.1 hypothetical protein CFC21_039592 [Triticum aestivum]VAH72080.1 unnamed protein product [Triticum turgidum subsp. durum]